MQVYKSIGELIKALASGPQNQSIGLVPTMGALHAGHLSLVEQSKAQNQLTICSVFVNPTQFNDPKDFDRYPRTIDTDSELLADAACDILFAPLTKEIYPVPDARIYDLGDITTRLEGAFRPGHFNGVASVVSRLFNIVNPTRAYFGLKDFQQYLVIKALVEKFNLNVQVVGCDIVRENNGLAMSSRNVLLNPEDRIVAAELFKALTKIKIAYGKVRLDQLSAIGKAHLDMFPTITTEYLEVVTSSNLAPIKDSVSTEPLRALVAVKIGGVRLIDNLEIV